MHCLESLIGLDDIRRTKGFFISKHGLGFESQGPCHGWKWRCSQGSSGLLLDLTGETIKALSFIEYEKMRSWLHIGIEQTSLLKKKIKIWAW